MSHKNEACLARYLRDNFLQIKDVFLQTVTELASKCKLMLKNLQTYVDI